MQKVSESGEFIFAWLRVLDELTYYELLEVQPTASGDQIPSRTIGGPMSGINTDFSITIF